MRIRVKLMLLVICLGLALVVNLAALGWLAGVVAVVQRTLEDVSRQQVVAVQMQTRLRDGEAALYRYLIEGEAGFAAQFAEQLRSFEAQIANYQAQAKTAEESGWADTLNLTHQEAARIGTELIELRDAQSGDLEKLETAQIELDTLLLGPVLAARPTDVAYQDIVIGQHENLRAAFLAVSAFLASPEETEPARFTEAVVDFQQYHRQFTALAQTPQEQTWVEAIGASFAEVESLGVRLINVREQQQTQFANFAAVLFRANEDILAGQIQPHAERALADARTDLQSALDSAVRVSLLFGLSASLLAAVIALPLFRQLNIAILALLRGAERVAAGNLSQPVPGLARDELGQLAGAFNAMMSDLAERERGLKARLSELEALRQVSLQITSTLDPGQVLDTIAASTLALVRATEVRIYVCDPAGGALGYAAHKRRDGSGRPGLPKAPRADGIVATAARTRQAQVINRAEVHPLFDTPEARQWGLKAAAALPLNLSNRVLGVLNVAYDDRETFSDDDLRTLSLLADQAAIALENARLYTSLSDRENRLQDLARKLAHVQEEERRLIGLDLHDGLTQILLSANMHLNTLDSLANGLEGQLRTELALGRARLQEAINEARQVAAELRPTVLEDFGLVGGLRHYAAELSRRENWQLEFSAQPGEVKLPATLERAVFRIAQEALSNARKYASSTRIRIVLQMLDNDLRLEVQDWGQGFDEATLSKESQRLGIVGMRERAALLNGECWVNSQPGAGTLIQVRVPLQPQWHVQSTTKLRPPVET
jgi:signal transduction histidine kinase